MFKHLFKKRSHIKENDKEVPNPQVDLDKLKEELKENIKKLETENDMDEQIQLLNKIGDAHYQLNQIDEAIESWNKSVDLMDKPKIGRAHV